MKHCENCLKKLTNYENFMGKFCVPCKLKEKIKADFVVVNMKNNTFLSQNENFTKDIKNAIFFQNIQECQLAIWETKQPFLTYKKI